MGSHDGVKYVDDFIGYLIEELKKRGRDKNTLPITSIRPVLIPEAQSNRKKIPAKPVTFCLFECPMKYRRRQLGRKFRAS